jgi:hypothetical protein
MMYSKSAFTNSKPIVKTTPVWRLVALLRLERYGAAARGQNREKLPRRSSLARSICPTRDLQPAVPAQATDTVYCQLILVPK